jgi:hypothetical protein
MARYETREKLTQDSDTPVGIISDLVIEMAAVAFKSPE